MSLYLKLATASTLDLLSYVYLMLANAIQLGRVNPPCVGRGFVGRGTSLTHLAGGLCPDSDDELELTKSSYSSCYIGRCMLYSIVSPLLGGQRFRSSAMASEVVLAFLVSR